MPNLALIETAAASICVSSSPASTANLRPSSALIKSSPLVTSMAFFAPLTVEFNRKLIKKGPNVQLKIDHVLNPTCLVIRQEAQGDHNGHDWQGQEA